MSVFDVHPFKLRGTTALREEVRAFLAANLPAGGKGKDRHTNCWAVGNRNSAASSARRISSACSGQEIRRLRTRRDGAPVRFEELLADPERPSARTGFPIAGRVRCCSSTGPKRSVGQYLPGMARGELFACIGLSEPGSGSDLASIRTSATRTDKGWRLDGQKVWTTRMMLR